MNDDLDDLLTDLELVRLTDRVNKSAQVRWLDSQRPKWKYTLTASGHPRVLRAYRDKRMGIDRGEILDAAPEPNWDKVA